MKTYTTSEIAEFEYCVLHAYDTMAGYGHKNIHVKIQAENGEVKDFKARTNNMYGFDLAIDIEDSQERHEALFELVEGELDGEIAEWIYDIEN